MKRARLQIREGGGQKERLRGASWSARCGELPQPLGPHPEPAGSPALPSHSPPGPSAEEPSPPSGRG